MKIFDYVNMIVQLMVNKDNDNSTLNIKNIKILQELGQDGHLGLIVLHSVQEQGIEHV